MNVDYEKMEFNIPSSIADETDVNHWWRQEWYLAKINWFSALGKVTSQFGYVLPLNLEYTTRYIKRCLMKIKLQLRLCYTRAKQVRSISDAIFRTYKLMCIVYCRMTD